MYYRRVRAGLAGALSVAAAALALVLTGAGPAAAGGPTSVLLSSPSNGQTASLYYTEKEYGRLEKALGPPEGAAPSPGKQPGLAAAMDAPRVNVTWMVHDTRPWRVDQVHPPRSGASGIVWIHTTTYPVEEGAGYWHEAKDGKRLLALLDRLKVLDKDPAAKAEGPAVAGSPGTTDRGGTASPKAGAQASGAGAERAGGDGELSVADGTTGWWWAIPGAGAGAALALSIRQALRGSTGMSARLRRRHPDDGDDDERGLPRQELIDN
ncbi:hypothetical protein DY218_06630 [Streptomyces triticagri]|uniref:Uncharacterized protein n=1 Tax=Streptomyces triticagri TaxID=2293568 RepID=A0A372M985_9ACTN|nr:hypothetical protein [Streptomyces triticagri]RFU87486.1 hypothetical protein DY218_06630 [Streptomyces triticagri]